MVGQGIFSKIVQNKEKEDHLDPDLDPEKEIDLPIPTQGLNQKAVIEENLDLDLNLDLVDLNKKNINKINKKIVIKNLLKHLKVKVEKEAKAKVKRKIANIDY